MNEWRRSTWALVLWSGLWLVLAIFVGARSGPTSVVAVLFSFYIPGVVILGLVWLLSRPRGRPCPACGYKVPKGVMECSHCGYDFGSLVAQSQAGAPPVERTD